MSRIFSRSPFLISVNEASQVGAKVELFVYYKSDGVPASPTKTLSKLISSSDSPEVLFNVSPYANDTITHPYPNAAALFSYETPVLDFDYKMMKVKRYKLIGTTYTLLDTTTYTCLDGYVINTLRGTIGGLDLGAYMLDSGSYEYLYDSNYTYTNDYKVGWIVVDNTIGWKYKYTNLVSGATTTHTTTTVNGLIYMPISIYLSSGAKLEILNASNVVLKTYYFRPKEECKYTPLTIDFINKYGVWRREFLYKNSINSINTESKEYRGFQLTAGNYMNGVENLTKTFNINGDKAIKTNTGWVSEDYKATIQEIMLSNRILIDNEPVICLTKSIELQKNISNKLINYPLEFKYTNQIIY